MPISAAVFDLDGLMFNTEDVFDIAGNELLERRALKMTDEIRNSMLGRRAPEAFRNLLDMTGLDESIDALIEESQEIFMGLLDDHLQPMPGLFDLLAHIKSLPLPTAVATSSHRAYVEDLLGRYDLRSQFDTTCTQEDVERGKPEPDIYLLAAERLGVPPTEMIVFEDSEAGTKAASSAGAITISVPHRHTASHDFSTATHIAESLADPLIYDLLAEHRLSP
ncbi:MAG: HAD family phosphatase [Planctomycetaceae bacterium]|nr:HAD family phosphatase [Planctomycetaceae bacterium]